MLEVYCGNNPVLVRTKAWEKIEEVNSDDYTVTSIDSENYSPGVIKNAVGAASLFGQLELFVLDMPSQSKEFQEEAIELIGEMNESQNLFVMIEGKLLAPQKKKLVKVGAAVEELSTNTENKFNPFAMSDALARRDKKTLWLLLQQAKDSGISDEETVGILWWQLKTMLLAERTNDATTAGVKDYPFKKATQALQKFKKGEVGNLANALLEIYHQGHGGEIELDLALEKWILGI
ncbi:hypothetical protein CL653_01145 [bacterium]|nr:hypothetical protein [bacterium]|tara:strand:+ start:754 stop:1455 length:702 start_codon:yes stop_codon:yes gene_type:complete